MNDALAMNDAGIAIRATGLTKAYKIYPRPIDRVLETLRGGVRHMERVALDNVDLELKRGEVVGILGRNGAGKSTLLKIVASTLEKTSGEVEVNGRVTAILELGTGFHPDYTGRENIYMGGLCLGMKRAEIDAKIDEVIDFSELRDVIDEPFKTYSTGMQARLTFSTAISTDPDILIVDEALSVGDARFQMKCFSWLKRLRDNNSTILLVSHDTNTITTFCDWALILENGRVYSEGPAFEMVTSYQRLLFGNDNPDEPLPDDNEGDGHNRHVDHNGSHETSKIEPESERDASHTQAVGEVYGSGEGHIVEYGIFDSSNCPETMFASGQKCKFFMTFEALTELSNYSLGIAVRDRRGTVLFGLTTLTQNITVPTLTPGDRIKFECDLTIWLTDGDYSITFGIAHAETGDKISFYDPGLLFKVNGPGGIFTTSVTNLEADVLLKKL